jgi:transglutaminase-like putative cysteine protease
MKTLSRFLFVLLVAVFSWALPAAEFESGLLDRDVVVAAAAAVTPQAFPDADDVLVENRTFTRYRADGTSETWDDAVMKVLTEKGQRGNRELSIRFALPYSEVTVPRLEMVKPDGTVVPVDVAAQSRVMVDPGQMGSNIYNPNDKVMKINVPGLEVGDLLRYLVYRKEVKVRVPDTWSDHTVAEYGSPILRYVVEVEAPAGLPLRHHVIRDEIPGTISYAEEKRPDGGVLHRWEVRNVPQVFAEPDMPSLYSVAQRILVSTIADWESVSRWYWQLCQPRLEATTPAMQAMVDELIAEEGSRPGWFGRNFGFLAGKDSALGKTDRRRRIEKIFYWVAQNIRYMGITTEAEAPGYEPHDVSVTFENRYGVCRDKAALLVAMFRMAGIEAYPVLILNGPRKDMEIPNPFFNHAITAVREADGSYLLMDPTDEKTHTLLPAYLSDCSYLVAHPDGDTLRVSPITPAEENRLRITTRGALTGNGALLAESELRFDGINDGAYRGWFARQRPEERRRAFEQIIKGVVPGAELLDFTMVPENLSDTATPLQVRLRYLAPDVLIQGGREVLMPLPWIGTRIGMVNFILGRTGLEQRRFPLKTDIACGVEEHFELRLDPGAVGGVLSLPETAPVDLPKIRWEQRLTLAENVLSGQGTFLLKGVEFTPAEYLELKKVLREMEFSLRKRPLFAAADAVPANTYGPDVNAVVLSDAVAIELTGPGAWREVRKVRKRILTYAGVKADSEMKLQFNPAWEEAKLLSATVTQPDGTVKAVRSEEMNLMDAPWVGGAPRYPAERILVVSLPGVAVGSVIEYEIERTCKEQPYFALTEYLQGFDPIEHKTVTVRNPQRLPLTVRDPGAAAPRRSDEAELTWTTAAAAPLVSEPGLPPLWTFVPHVAVSTGDWPTYAGETRRLLAAAADGSAAAAAKAAELVAAEKDAMSKIRRIRDFVARSVRRAGPGLDRLPTTAITPADRVLQDGYGNGVDHAVLLTAMLTAVGFSPEIILASGCPDLPQLAGYLRDTPRRHVFDQVLVRLEVDGAPVFLNDSDQYGELGTTASEGMLALRLLDGVIAPITPAADFRAQSASRWEIAVDEDGTAAIAVTQTVQGPAFGATRRQYDEMPPEERRRHFQEMVAGVSQSAVAVGDLVTDFAAYPGRIEFHVTVPRYAVREGDRLLLFLPGGLGGIPGVGADRRQQPLWWSGISRGRSEYRIRLPDASWTPTIVPPEQQWTLPGDSTIVVRTAKPEAGELVVVHELDWRPGWAPRDAYGWLLEVNRRLAHPQQRAILLERAAKEQGGNNGPRVDP